MENIGRDVGGAGGEGDKGFCGLVISAQGVGSDRGRSDAIEKRGPKPRIDNDGSVSDRLKSRRER